MTLGIPSGGRKRPECGEKNTARRPSGKKTSDGVLWSSRPRPRNRRCFVSLPPFVSRATQTCPTVEIQPVNVWPSCEIARGSPKYDHAPAPSSLLCAIGSTSGGGSHRVWGARAHRLCAASHGRAAERLWRQRLGGAGRAARRGWGQRA